MRRVCFKDLPANGVDVAVIEAQALNYFSVHVLLEGESFELMQDDTEIYHRPSVVDVNEDLSCLNIQDLYLHHSETFQNLAKDMDMNVPEFVHLGHHLSSVEHRLHS
ncbi:MAG: hypothetical protein KAG18_04585 [Sinobacterium sp.]|nr:hypothetical protein [Sinobacterium sp.]